MRKTIYITPTIEVISLSKLLDDSQEGGYNVNGSRNENGGDNNRSAKGWFGDFGDDPSAPTPVGGTATQGTGKEALELPTQNRRIWGD